jgi:hypothetical protein
MARHPLHTHNLFVEPMFSDAWSALRIPLSLQDIKYFDVTVYADHIDDSTHDPSDWHLLDCETGQIVLSSHG